MRLARTLVLATVCLAVLAGSSVAQDHDEHDGHDAREVHAARARGPIAIDGVLDEAAWAAAEPCSTFTQRDPNEGKPASQRTEVRILYDENALYVGARLWDASADSIVRELSRRDSGTRSDKFLFYLDPYFDRRSGYYFGLNAAGTPYDGTLFNDSWNDDSWDGVWEGRSRVDRNGWTIEMRIPFSQLRFMRTPEQKWGVNFQRQMGRGFEDDYFMPRPKKASGFVSLFATMTGIENVAPRNAREIVPYATSKSSFVHHTPGDPFHDGQDMTASAGGDLRMPVGSKLTLNATVNPDFGQVEVDPAVVNLSDVETFFPEKRPFFVEGSSIFDAGQQGASDYWGFNFPQPTFFYSRRIGAAPAGGLPDATAYSDEPPGTTILGAAKLSGKLAPGLNFGMMHALTAREVANVQLEDGARLSHEVEPLAYYGAVRALQEFGQRRNGLGTLVTVTARDLHDPVVRDEFNRASIGTVIDGWHFLDANKVWILSGWAAANAVNGTASRIAAIQTSSRHYFQRPDAEGYAVDSSATTIGGTGARVWLNKEKGNWLSNSSIGYLSPGFELNDLGFESRTDVVNTHLGLGYRWTTPTKQVKNHNVIGALFGSRNFAGDVINAGAWARAFWWFTNNWTFQPGFAYNPQTVNPRRSRGGPLMLNAPGYEISLNGDTDGSRKRYYNVNYYSYLQPAENSYDYEVYPFFSFKPRPNIKLDLGPGYQSQRNGAYYVATEDDAGATATFGHRYVFARLDQQTVSGNLRLNVSFTPAISLQFYGQPLISTGRYSDFKELARPRSLDFVGQGAGQWTYDPVTREFDLDGAGTASSPEVFDFNSKSFRGNAVFRWEYRPGSALYLVWTQQRTNTESVPDLDLSHSLQVLGNAPRDNIFLAKLTWYLNR